MSLKKTVTLGLLASSLTLPAATEAATLESGLYRVGNDTRSLYVRTHPKGFAIGTIYRKPRKGADRMIVQDTATKDGLWVYGYVLGGFRGCGWVKAHAKGVPQLKLLDSNVKPRCPNDRQVKWPKPRELFSDWSRTSKPPVSHTISCAGAVTFGNYRDGEFRNPHEVAATQGEVDKHTRLLRWRYTTKDNNAVMVYDVTKTRWEFIRAECIRRHG